VLKIHAMGTCLSLASILLIACTYRLECQTRMWCLDGPKRFIDFSRVFAEHKFTVSFPGDSAPCILVESEDTFWRVSSFNHSDYLTDRLERQMAKGFSVQRKLSMYSPFGLFSSCRGSECTKLVSPYRRSCVALCGQSISGEVKVSVSYKSFNWKYPLLFLVGMGIFLSAPYLSKKLVFYYTFGVSLGTLLSVLIIVFFILKRSLPKNKSFLSIIVATFAQSVFGAVSLFRGWWENLLRDHIEFVFLYLTLASLMSFALTHWLLKGPEGVQVGAGLQDIVRVGIRLVGALVMSLSSGSLTMSITICAIGISGTTLYSSFNGFLDELLDCFNPNRDVTEMKENYLYGHRFQSVEEYSMIGKIETENQLKNLVQNPEFQKWAMKNVDRITVTPVADT